LECKKPFEISGLGAEIKTQCPGGLCTNCGKPAVAAFAREYLTTINSSRCPQGDQVDLLHAGSGYACIEDVEDLLKSVLHARSASIRFMDAMKRARERSLETRKSVNKGAARTTGMTPLSEVNLGKAIHLAEMELRDVNARLESLGKANTFMDLEGAAREIEHKLETLTKDIRHLRSSNMRKERELERLSKEPISVSSKEDALRRELVALKSRNTQLALNIEANEKAFEICRIHGERLRDQVNSARGLPPITLTARRADLVTYIDGLRREKTRLLEAFKKHQTSDKFASLGERNRSLVEATPSVSVIQPDATGAIEHFVPGDENVSISAFQGETVPEIPEQRSEQHHQADPVRLDDPSPQAEVDSESPNPVSDRIESDSENLDRSSSQDEEDQPPQKEESFKIPDLVIGETPSDEFSEEVYHATDEALTTRELAEVEEMQVPPRRLFQSVVVEQDEQMLGMRTSDPPLIRVPHIFLVDPPLRE
jgi:hypothetical protein